MRWSPALLALAMALPARADPIPARYAAYVRGVEIVVLDTEIDVAPDAYRVRLQFQTVGPAAVAFRGTSDTVAQGRFVAGQPVPNRFFSTGVFRGTPRAIQLEYPGGTPQIRQLIPPPEEDRLPVPPEDQVRTIDSVSAMADLMHQVNATGRCERRTTVFDGRRLSALEATTFGPDTVPPSPRSRYTGPALRCDIVSRQTGGFMKDSDPATRGQPQQARAWFAAVTPGGPLIPVRITLLTRFFGEATLYLK